ncbi:MAG: hypothetical protein H7X84_01520 [Verrucomicrobia bacterium]|nr:hypothetical protein [Prolixibacteraceae bacterium]
MIEEKRMSKACFYYEMFMERAYGMYEPNVPGYHACIMRNLITAEKGKIVSIEIVTHFEKQLTEIKKDMEDALDSYLAKPNFPKEIIDELKKYKSQVVWAVCSEELMEIVFKTIDLTVSVPIKMKLTGFEFS